MSGRCASCAMYSAYRPRAITPGDHGQRARARSPLANCRAISGGFMPSTGADMGAAYPRRTACRGPECQPQADRAGDAPAWHPGSRAASLSCVHNPQQAFSADRGHPARPEFRGREAGSEPAPAKAGVWLADITDIPAGEGWLYLAVILDRFTMKLGATRHSPIFAVAQPIAMGGRAFPNVAAMRGADIRLFPGSRAKLPIVAARTCVGRRCGTFTQR